MARATLSQVVPERIPSLRGRTLAIGFGTTVAMWAVGYVSMMKPGLVLGEALFAATLGCLFVGGWVAGRTRAHGESSVVVGMRIGALSATINLLLIGSLIGGKSSREMMVGAFLWGAGTYLVSITLCIVGSALGAMKRSEKDRNWPFRFYCVAAVTVFLLLITGGLVTGLQAGLAVPDWPNSFGHNMLLYPLSEMIGGVYYEHAHRLYGMLVGVTAITVAVSMFMFDRRGWLRTLAVAYLLAVCVQGYMGGMRVTEISTTLAIIHGVFAQIVFATIVCIAAFTSTPWRSAVSDQQSAGTDIRPTRAERNWALALTILFVVQIALGALYRHMQRAMADPPQPLHPLYTHIGVAVLIAVLAVFIGGRAWGRYPHLPVLAAIGRALLMLVGWQVLLGVAATIAVWLSRPNQPPPTLELAITTAHQVTGALLLATSGLLTAWTWRHERGTEHSAGTG